MLGKFAASQSFLFGLGFPRFIKTCLFYIWKIKYSGSYIYILAPRFPGTCVVVVQLLSHAWFFVTPRTIAHQAPLSSTISWSFCSYSYTLSSVQFSRSVVSDSLQPHGLQHARPPCPSPTPGAYSNSRPLSWWCHPTISSSVIPFSSCVQSFPASGSFQMRQFFVSGGQNIGVSASASVQWIFRTNFL